MNNIVARQGLTTDQQLIVNSEFEKKKKSKAVAYLLWIFLGSLGGHRFYFGDIGIGIGMIIVWIVSWFLMFIPIAIWVLIDVFFVSKRVEQLNERIEANIINQVKSLHQVG
ncbi:TM2 domain-containing protein [Brevibacillus centrosporus]|jgi:TM2 domain-containing membrane protein YozV|uniref:TM2 domain-containing protein n=1 Tax=Brevibacillus centrosporus TaxID=54910 RepID=UPI002E1C309F|nr:TM2 domain-containing protein [Brevibacillus centrosporus]